MGERTLRGALAAVAAVAAVVLAGCSFGGGDAVPSEAPLEPSAAAAPEVEVEDSAEPDASAEPDPSEGSSSAGVEDFDAAEVTVEQTVTIGGRPEDQLTLGVHSLTVEGEVMVLKMVLTPDFASEPDGEELRLFQALGGNTPGFFPRLVDGANLKEYSVIGGIGSGWNSDAQTLGSNGDPMTAWAYYSAPEDDIDTIDIRVNDGWPAFLDVPITR